MNNFLRRMACVILSFTVILCVCGCNANNNGDVDETVSRAPYVKEEILTYDADDGIFDYEEVKISNIKDYTIIVPTDNSECIKAAKELQKYYSDMLKISLEIATDENKETAKEILIGETNRSQSKVPNNQIISDVIEEKIVLLGNHDVTTRSAVNKLIRLNPQSDKVFTFSITSDFEDTKLDGYKYVWGDEFEGTDLDFTKWMFEDRMEATKDLLEIRYDRDVINVEDGRLKLHAIRQFNPEKIGREFCAPYTVSSTNNMNFKYGYAEIRALVPMFTGAWPSWWSMSMNTLSGKAKPSFNGEIDFFEVFGDNVIKPNLIKWYEIPGKPSEQHQFGTSDRQSERTFWTWNTEEDKMSYHIYAFEWTDKVFKCYVDGDEYCSIDLTKTYGKRPEMDGFHYARNMMFNNHIFTKDSYMPNARIDASLDLLPARYYIDYVRLYQKPGMGELYIDETENKYPDRK